MTVIYHLTTAADWEEGQRAGEYTTSTRGRTIAEQGFMHASTAAQVAPVANSFYKGVPGLLVLVIDTGRLASPLKWDDVPGWDEPFPHVYGPLNLDAVIGAVPLEPGAGGEITFEPPAIA